MIVEQLVPEVYYNKSRDFAYIARALEIVFNYMKTAADNVGVDPTERTDSNIIALLVNTLGFETKHEYAIKDLVYVASSFSEMLRKKGSLESIELAIKTLLNAQKISSNVIEKFYEYDSEKKELLIRIPSDMVDLVLLDDILDYILPAGVIYYYQKISKLVDDSITNTSVYIDDGHIESSRAKSTTRIHNIYDDPNADDKNLGTLYTGTTIDDIITGESTQ